MGTRARTEGTVDPERRSFLIQAGRLVVAAPAVASWLLLGCSSGEEATPAAEPVRGQSESPPQPASPAAKESPTPAPGAGAGSAPQAAAGSATDALVTEVSSAAGMIQELSYVNESPHADKRCDNCLLYSARSEGRGACQLFSQGLVASGGWCLSWAKRLDG